MSYTIRATRTPITHGAIYEARLFTEAELTKLVVAWKIQRGTIQDKSHKGLEVIRFTRRSA